MSDIGQEDSNIEEMIANNLKALEVLLQGRGDDITNDDLPPIHVAARRRNAVEELDALVRADGSDPSQRVPRYHHEYKYGDGMWVTPLSLALESQRLENFEYLLEKGADFGVVLDDMDGHTVLHEAAHARSGPAFLRPLLAHGAGVDARDAWEHTPLYWACRLGWRENIGFLLRNGADPMAVKEDGATALRVAALEGKIDGVRELLSWNPVLAWEDNLMEDAVEKFATYKAKNCEVTMKHCKTVIRLLCQARLAAGA